MSNKLTNNDVALDIESGSGDSIQGNQASTTSANIYATGIYVYDEMGSSFQGNKVSGGAVGIYNDSTATGNTYKGNQASGSTTFDCQDTSAGSGTAGTANTWQGDKGATSSPPGICKKN